MPKRSTQIHNIKTEQSPLIHYSSITTVTARSVCDSRRCTQQGKCFQAFPSMFHAVITALYCANMLLSTPQKLRGRRLLHIIGLNHVTTTETGKTLCGKCGGYGPPFANRNNSRTDSLIYKHCDYRCHGH